MLQVVPVCPTWSITKGNENTRCLRSSDSSEFAGCDVLSMGAEPGIGLTHRSVGYCVPLGRVQIFPANIQNIHVSGQLSMIFDF